MDRVPDFESVGWGFESLRGRQMNDDRSVCCGRPIFKMYGKDQRDILVRFFY